MIKVEGLTVKASGAFVNVYDEGIKNLYILNPEEARTLATLLRRAARKAEK